MNDHTALGRYNQIPVEFFKFLENNAFSGPVVFELPYKEIHESCEYLKKVHPFISNIPSYYEKNM